jgi:hypothetical protein
MPYPDSNFNLDQDDDDQYGGGDPDIIDSDAWTYVTGKVRAIALRFLSHARVPWSTAVVVVQESVTVGDALAMDMSRDFTDPTTQLKLPFVARYTTIVAAGGTPQFIGVAVAVGAALAKAQIAVGGMLPQAITGLGTMTGGAKVSVNPATSRLKAWVGGDTAVGMTTPSGCVLLDSPRPA